MRHAFLAVLVLACACSGGGGEGGSSAPGPGGGTPPPPAPDVAVSGLSPFDVACGGTGGTVYRNAEVEPHLVADPRDARHLVAMWQQDRWSNGSSRGLVAAASFDGGATWSMQPMPFSVCGGGTAAQHDDYLRVTDPWLAIGADGTAYAIGLSTIGGDFTATSVSAILVSRSADGGRTWSPPTTVIRDVGAVLNDKETISADPRDSRFVYATWDRVDAASAGPTLFARSVDGGASWEAARVVFDPGSGAQTIGNLIRVLPDGTLVDLYVRLVGDETHVTESALEVIRSTDRGASWSAPVRISAYRALGASDPLTGRPIRDGSVLAQMAVAPDGSLDVAWQDARFTGVRDAIALARSTDGGLTWSTPARVNADPAAVAFTPQVDVGADGTIGVSYYVLAPGAEGAPAQAERRVARSADGAQWAEASASAPFDLSSAPIVDGAYFLGDYMGLASAGADFLSLHVRATGSAADPTNVFIARVTPQAAKRAVTYRAEVLAASERGAEFDRRVFAHLARARCRHPCAGRMR